jgi:hypothetical protein
LPPPALRTSILLQADRRKKSSAPELRQAFSEQVVALTAYDGGVVRLSMPAEGWHAGELDHLQVALRAAS